MTPFQYGIKFVLDHEGGYVNDPKDLGGETKYGISKRTFPDVDIKNLTLAQAQEIYRTYYWNQYNLDSAAFPLNIVAFDSYVQHSPKKVSEWLQMCGGDINKFLEFRRNYYYLLVEKRPANNRFIKGWIARINDLKKYIQIVTQDSQI